MKTVAFYTLGCKLNFSETSTIARALRSKGFEVVDFHSAPEIYIINTCSVTENADRKCRKVVRDALKLSPEAFVVVIGCYAQLKPKEISNIQGVNLVLGAAEKFRLPEILSQAALPGIAKVMACDISKVELYHSSYSIADRTRSFLKIQDGCDYGCTFCTIPKARGRSRSDTIENILLQANDIVQAGGKEIVLTGVNTGDFGIIDGKRQTKFIHLLHQLEGISEIERIRISSIEPNLLTNDVIALVANSEKFVPHFHIPLQSGSDTILKLMRRRYLTDLYKQRIDRVKFEMPHSCIGADVMVGFPGETEDLFMETYNFLLELPVNYLHVFTYSERQDTLAVDMPGKVDMDVRSKRSKMLRILSDKKKRAFYAEHVNEVHKVLIEQDMSNGRIHGFTDNYIRVGIPEDPTLINQLLEVKLQGIDAGGVMIGEPIEVNAI
jgi:threonylcarbamoyladenosine tRNA methylthiotransferase MtaB